MDSPYVGGCSSICIHIIFMLMNRCSELVGFHSFSSSDNDLHKWLSPYSIQWSLSMLLSIQHIQMMSLENILICWFKNSLTIQFDWPLKKTQLRFFITTGQSRGFGTPITRLSTHTPISPLILTRTSLRLGWGNWCGTTSLTTEP